jgi:hypothetical protein
VVTDPVQFTKELLEQISEGTNQDWNIQIENSSLVN